MFQSAPGTEAGGNQKRQAFTNLRTEFQSAPGTEAGGNFWTPGPGTFLRKFQSAPGTEAGGNAVHCDLGRCADGFNPPPALRPGETRRSPCSGARETVSIRPRH